MKFGFLFPGQGSQSLGMMSAYGASPIVRETFDLASNALGRDLWALATDGPSESLNQTVNTQPLMLTANIAVWRLWQSMGGYIPSLLAGHSLGEYAALVAANVLSLEDAVPLVEFRAIAMQEAVPNGYGAMAAILGLDQFAVKQVCADASNGDVVEAVNFNAPEQTVIAGHAQAVERAIKLAREQGAKRALLLPVSAPFHCTLMKPAAERLKERLQDVQFRKPNIPVLNNVDVLALSEPEAIRDALVRQAASPVRWVEIMRFAWNSGITAVYECGPGRVLTGLAKRCAENLQVGAMNDIASVKIALASVRGQV